MLLTDKILLVCQATAKRQSNDLLGGTNFFCKMEKKNGERRRKIKTKKKFFFKKWKRGKLASQMRREWVQVLSHLKQEMEMLADTPATPYSPSLSGSFQPRQSAMLVYRRCFTDD